MNKEALNTAFVAYLKLLEDGLTDHPIDNCICECLNYHVDLLTKIRTHARNVRDYQQHIITAKKEALSMMLLQFPEMKPQA